MNTNTQFNSEQHSLTLLRFPEQHPKSSLQAWDSADEYALNHLASLEIANGANLAIVNDDFGAISCALREFDSSVFSDSFMSHMAIKHNLARNQLPPMQVNSSLDLEHEQAVFDVVIIKVPRTLALLEQQLVALQTLTHANTIIIGAGKVKMVTSNAIKLFEKYLGETKTSLAVKKSRLIFSKVRESQSGHTPAEALFPTIVNDNNLQFRLYNQANVFCREQLDIGARFLLKHLPKTEGHCIDLGCGNGVLGITMLHQNEALNVSFVDESFMAIASAKETLVKALGEDVANERASFAVGHCLQQMIESDAPLADLILCNPPFHQQSVVTEEIAWQMFSDAKDMLAPGGELRIVANRHLEYAEMLKRIFGGCKVVANNPKFTILNAYVHA